jgi:hypothetical protein
MEAYAIMEKVQQSIDAAGLPEHFSGAKLVAWDGATRTATMAVRLGRYVRGERAGDEPAGSAVLECQVPLIALDVRSPFGAEPPKSKLIAGGDELRTHRSGATCVLSTVLAETNPKDVRQGFRLRAWLRDETGEWRNLRLPATWVERNYAMARATDGALVVAELVTTGSERVLRSTRWTMGQTELAPVVTEKALAQPPAKDAIIVWQTTSHGPVAWSIENGRATLVR